MHSQQSSVPRLIADIGGTNARFALLDGMQHRDEMVLSCADYPDVVTAVEHYLQQVGASSAGLRPREARGRNRRTDHQRSHPHDQSRVAVFCRECAPAAGNVTVDLPE